MTYDKPGTFRMTDPLYQCEDCGAARLTDDECLIKDGQLLCYACWRNSLRAKPLAVGGAA
jgi:hypothetical protein